MIRALLVFAACLALSPQHAHADEFRLRDGRVVFGEVLEETPKHVRIRTAAKAFGTLRERKLLVRDIQAREPGPCAAVAIEAHLRAFEGRAAPAATRRTLADQAFVQRLDAWIGPLLADHLDDPDHGADLRARFAGFLPPDASRKGDAASVVALWPPGIAPGRLRKPTPAVREALDWLAAHQDDDGRLDADGFMKHDPADDKCDGGGGGHHGERVPCRFDGAVTGVAMLAWMASGSTPVSGPYAEAITKGTTFCRKVVAAGPRGFDQIWNHGFCVQALAEVYWLGRDTALRPVLVRGVRDLLAAQHPDGGWRYIPRAPSGVPTSAVVATALAMCARVGVPVPRASVDKLVAYFEARLDPGSGRSEYHDGAERLGYTPTRANTAAALVGMGLWPHLAPRPQLSRRLAALVKHKPRWKIEFKEVKTKDGRTVRAQVGYLYPYAWYYTDLAIALHAPSRKGWRGALRKALTGAQRKDGAARGSWDPKGTYSDSGGRVFVTALGALMLLSPHRYR